MAGKFTARENAERPAEPLYRAVQGSNFGGPYCFWDYGMMKYFVNRSTVAMEKKDEHCGSFTPPVVAFPAHWAPVDLMFYTGAQFPAKYRNGALIAFHGSWNRKPEPQASFNVTFQPFVANNPSGRLEVFADGFQREQFAARTRDRSGRGPEDEDEFTRVARLAVARPDGVAQAPDGSLYITDSQKGKIWRVIYTGRK